MNGTGILYVFTVACLASACSDQTADEFNIYRAAVARELIDPASAQFRDEAIRTLWSTEGLRLKIYCFYVNSNNSFGRKTGFQPGIYVIDSNSERNSFISAYKDGVLFVDHSMNFDFYLNCVRSDTQRTSEKIFMVTPQIGPFNDESKREADQMVPVISSLPAPEER